MLPLSSSDVDYTPSAIAEAGVLPGAVPGTIPGAGIPETMSPVQGTSAGLPEVIRRILCERGMGISPREVEIICYIMAERKDLFIANEMGISYNTLRTQLSRLFRKLGVHSRTGVVVAVFTEVIRRMGDTQTTQECIEKLD